jgi:predicted dehydrogenase
MAEVAKETGVATQVAVGNQASEATRQLCEWIGDGVIGRVTRVMNWSSRPFWPQGIDRPTETPPVPAGLDWDLWVGPSAMRPYHSAYLPFVWRGWYDFGSGAIGDMGCYSFDTIFRALRLEASVSVETSTSELCPETYPKASILHWRFAARGNMPPVWITWWDGGLMPSLPDELTGGKPLEREGLLFVGDKGNILCDFHGTNPRLIPEARMKAFVPPPKTLPRSPGNEREWINACKGGKQPCGANFEFTARVTETIQLANVAQRAGGILKWDSAALRAANVSAAQPYIRPEYRRGWEL